MNYSGIDLHSNNCVVVVTDEADRIFVQKRVQNDLSKVLELLEPYREGLVGVVVESTYNGTGWWMDCKRRGSRCIWRTR
jgi:hypothetical protein